MQAKLSQIKADMPCQTSVTDGAGSDSAGHYVRTGSGTHPFSSSYYYSSSGIAVLGGTNPLPKLSSTVLGPATYVSSSRPIFFRSSSTDSSHLNLRSPKCRVPSGFRTVRFLQGPISCILKRCPRHLSLPVLSP